MLAALSVADWTKRAACAGGDTDLWFPEHAQPNDEAKAVCAACPVTKECLAYAVTHRIEHGIWGGLTARQRQRRKEK